MIKWTDNLSIGVKEIDEQHKKLVDILNTLYAAFIDKEADFILNDILDKLIQYADFHFKTEEKYFKIFNYENTKEHIREHENFVIEVNQFKRDFENRRSAVTYKVMTFLSNWLLKHINGSDKEYSKCFRKNGLR